MKVNSESAIAIVRLIVTIAVAIASTFGWVLDADLLFNILLSVAALFVLVWAWWKNNNLTAAAQEAQSVLDWIKQNQHKDGEDIATVVKIQSMSDKAEEVA